MWFKHRAWIPVSWLLSIANVGAIWPAAVAAQPLHATAHGLLAVLFGVGALHLARRGRPAVESGLTEQVEELEDRMSELDRLPPAQGRLSDLEERLDFLERALVEVRARSQRAQAPGQGGPPA